MPDATGHQGWGISGKACRCRNNTAKRISVSRRKSGGKDPLPSGVVVGAGDGAAADHSVNSQSPSEPFAAIGCGRKRGSLRIQP